MAYGTRQQPEKNLDSLLAPKSSKRKSRKKLKQWQNRKLRHLARRQPDVEPQPKYKGWEW